MVVKREGYRYLSTQLAQAVWDALANDAEVRGQSMAQRLNEVLAKVYRIPASKIPPRRRPGRRPKKGR